jgi:hypothetical protein
MGQPVLKRCGSSRLFFQRAARADARRSRQPASSDSSAKIGNSHWRLAWGTTTLSSMAPSGLTLVVLMREARWRAGHDGMDVEDGGLGGGGQFVGGGFFAPIDKAGAFVAVGLVDGAHVRVTQLHDREEAFDPGAAEFVAGDAADAGHASKSQGPGAKSEGPSAKFKGPGAKSKGPSLGTRNSRGRSTSGCVWMTGQCVNRSDVQRVYVLPCRRNPTRGSSTSLKHGWG